MELYDWLLLGHILSAIAWVGGAITMQIMGNRLVRAESAEAVAAFSRTAEWIGPRLYMPASLAVLGFGIALVSVSDAWSIGQLWIILALVGIAISAIGGGGVFGPPARRVSEGLQAGGGGSGGGQAPGRR